MKIVKVSQKYKDMSDKELETFLRQKLSMDPAWARRALLALYDEQTEAERADPHNVHESNGGGFSPQDQEFLSSLAEQALRDESFSMKQLGWLYTLLPKYSKQIVKLIRTMERMEPSFVHKLYFANVTTLSHEKTMSAVTGDLELDPDKMPTYINVYPPDERYSIDFMLADVVKNEGKIEAFIYKNLQKEHDGWKLIITVGPAYEMPGWVEDMGNLLTGKGKSKGLKK